MKNKQKQLVKYNGFWKWFFYIQILLFIVIIGYLLKTTSSCTIPKVTKCSSAFNCTSIGNHQEKCDYCVNEACETTQKITCTDNK